MVLELAQYVTSNARVEAESIAASGAPDRDLPALQDELSSHRITLGGGFAVVYGKDLQYWPASRRRRNRARPACCPGFRMKASWDSDSAARAALGRPSFLRAAQR